ncbi:MAG: DUF4280 domain-containing protein [Clostridia bacterium]|nr:DUF4280 domain-containing protein [Clostridia bacterium]
MSNLVCSGAALSCTFGAAPGQLMVLPVKRVNCGPMPAANIMDHMPIVNVMPFGMCSCPANPAVAAATAAALGVLTPMPCVPVTPMPWFPGCPTLLISNMPALNNSSKLMCQWGGIIQIMAPGQMTVMVP